MIRCRLTRVVGSKQWNMDHRSLVSLQTVDNTTAVAYINRRGEDITYAYANDKGPVATVRGEKYFDSYSALTRNIEYHC